MSDDFRSGMAQQLKTGGLFVFLSVAFGVVLGIGSFLTLLFYQMKQAPTAVPLLFMALSLPSFGFLIHSVWFQDGTTLFNSFEVWIVMWCRRLSKVVLIVFLIYLPFLLAPSIREAAAQVTEKQMLSIVLLFVVLNYFRK